MAFCLVAFDPTLHTLRNSIQTFYAPHSARFKDTTALMKISKIWFSGIRTLNNPGAPQTMGLSVPQYLATLHQTPPLTPGDVNILLGENGAGKSTLIDMIRGLRFPEILASLPRENPPHESYPLYSIEFNNGDCWSYLFAPDNSIPIDEATHYIHCQQLVSTSTMKQSRASNLYKLALTNPLPRFFNYPDILYRNGTQATDDYDQRFVDELNIIRKNLRGLAIARNSVGKQHLTSSSFPTSSSFHISGSQRVGVWLDDDHHMSNALQGDWLPSGWKAFAWLSAWLRHAPMDTICLIEEPETHLHPRLMRYLMETLIEIASKRRQQLFISTHSAALINIASNQKLKIFQSHGTHIECKPDLGEMLDQMGYKASDILQANCVIWVEGPSDRLYLNYWIQGMAPDLREGTHYSIMFYGGRLLAHLTAEEDEQDVTDLISLTRLNRHSAIVLDSDKSAPNKHINATKKRIVQAFASSPERLAWITKGREVENYLNMDALEACVLSVHPSAAKLADKSTWANLLEYKKPRGRKCITANKVKVAAAYVDSQAVDYSILDLQPRIEQLCQFIRRWNQ